MNQTRLATRLIFFAFGLCLSSWAPMVPFAKERLDINDAQLGMLLFVIGFGALITMPLTGWLVQRFGSRMMTVLAGLCVSGLLPTLAIAATPLSLGLVLFFFGAVTGLMNVSINAQAVAVEIKSQASIMSGFHCFFSAGGLLGALMVSALLEMNCPLPLCAAAVAFLIIYLLLLKRKHLLSASEEQKGECEKKRFSSPSPAILFLGLICFISFLAEGSMLDWSAEYLRSVRGYDPSIAGIGYALFSIAMAFGRLVGDQLISRFTILKVFQSGCFLAASGFFLVVYPWFMRCELLGFCFIGFGASNIVPILFSASGRIPNANAGHALTIVTTLGYAGGLIGPAFIGFLAEATSLSLSLASIALCLIAAGSFGKRVIPAPFILDRLEPLNRV